MASKLWNYEELIEFNKMDEKGKYRVLIKKQEAINQKIEGTNAWLAKVVANLIKKRIL